MSISSILIMRAKATETLTTAIVCFVSDFWSGQIIFLNSAFMPLNQLVFWVFVVSPIFSLPFRSLRITSSPYEEYVSCRNDSISWFPFCPGDSSFLWSCCSYAVCTPYMPMWSLRAQLSTSLFYTFCLLMILRKSSIFRHKKKSLNFHSPVYYIIPLHIASSFFSIKMHFAIFIFIDNFYHQRLF